MVHDLLNTTLGLWTSERGNLRFECFEGLVRWIEKEIHRISSIGLWYKEERTPSSTAREERMKRNMVLEEMQ